LKKNTTPYRNDYSLVTTVRQHSINISQLSNNTTQLEQALTNGVAQLEQKFNELNERFKKVREALEFMEIGLNRRFVFKEWRCTYIDDRGYCKFVAPYLNPSKLNLLALDLFEISMALLVIVLM